MNWIKKKCLVNPINWIKKKSMNNYLQWIDRYDPDQKYMVGGLLILKYGFGKSIEGTEMNWIQARCWSNYSRWIDEKGKWEKMLLGGIMGVGTSSKKGVIVVGKKTYEVHKGFQNIRKFWKLYRAPTPSTSKGKK